MHQSVHRTRIKICGMTEPSKVAAAVALGVDAIGVILHAKSPRTISIETAKTLRAEVPAFVSLVGVFVNASSEFIEDAITSIGLDIVQLHGEETNHFGVNLSRPFIKAIRAKTVDQVVQDCACFPDALALLLDPYVDGQHGGTGRQLNTDLWPQQGLEQPLILAGGLSPNNVAQRIKSLSPYAVDLNSGLESAPGEKDIDLMMAAVSHVNQADCSA